MKPQGLAEPIDMKGRTYGRLRVRSIAGKSKDGHAMWHCRCACGARLIVNGEHLRGGHTRTCGASACKALL
jgi:hypothetical protein